MSALRRLAPRPAGLPVLSALPSVAHLFAPELHRDAIRSRLTLVDGDPETEKKSNTADARQKRS